MYICIYVYIHTLPRQKIYSNDYYHIYADIKRLTRRHRRHYLHLRVGEEGKDVKTERNGDYGMPKGFDSQNQSTYNRTEPRSPRSGENNASWNVSFCPRSVTHAASPVRSKYNVVLRLTRGGNVPNLTPRAALMIKNSQRALNKCIRNVHYYR